MERSGLSGLVLLRLCSQPLPILFPILSCSTLSQPILPGPALTVLLLSLAMTGYHAEQKTRRLWEVTLSLRNVTGSLTPHLQMGHRFTSVAHEGPNNHSPGNLGNFKSLLSTSPSILAVLWRPGPHFPWPPPPERIPPKRPSLS